MTAAAQYSERLAARTARSSHFDQWHERLGAARLLLAAALLVVAWACLGMHFAAPLWTLAPLAAFIALVLYHQRLKQQRLRAHAAAAFYREGIERLEGRWHARCGSGTAFVPAHHVYAADLDLFGTESVYARLCAARTPMGERTLAAWLLTPADLVTIRVRHACVDELREGLDLREDLAILGRTPRIALEPEVLADWARAPDALGLRGLRPAVLSLVALALAGGIFWAVTGIATPFLLVVVVEAAVNYVLRGRVQRCVAGVEHAYEDLKLLGELLSRVERESFTSPALRALQATLAQPPASAAQLLAQLATIVNFVEARRNPLLVPVMLPLLYTLLAAFAAERWRVRHGRAVAAWLAALGEIEALNSIAGYAFEHAEQPFPEFVEGAAQFSARDLGHPLIGADVRVRNCVELGGATRVLLVSGSNMSGKSTLLRAVGVNSVLAMAGAPVCAAALRMTPMQVGACIHVNDSLHEGSSRFYAEITRLRQLFEPSALPLLFLLDELLQGTNSNDRRIGAHGVLRALIARGAIGLVSTHDLALGEGDWEADALKNVHFQDQLESGRLSFDFKLRDGVVTKSNGIELMRAIGLDV